MGKQSSICLALYPAAEACTSLVSAALFQKLAY